MANLYIYSLLAGLLLANGVPHFVAGISGKKHMTPFGRPSSATVNVIWGWLNLVIGMLLLHLAHPRAHELRSFAFVAVGALITGIFSATLWSKHPEFNKQ